MSDFCVLTVLDDFSNSHAELHILVWVGRVTHLSFLGLDLSSAKTDLTDVGNLRIGHN